MRIKEYYKYLIILGLTVISILINGYHFEYADQEIYFAYLPVYTGESPYSNSDLLMLGKHTGGNYYTFLWYLLMPLFRIFGMEWTFFIVHLINLYLIFVGFYFLTKRLMDSQTGAENLQSLKKKIFGVAVPILLALILLLTKKFVAGVSMVTVEPYLHPRNIALVLLFFAIERYLADKRIFAFCLVGLAANIHLLSAGIILFCLVVSVFFNKQELQWKQFIFSLIGFLICSMPIWMWIMVSSTQTIPSNISNQLWLAIMQYRTSYLFPQLWTRLGWLAFLSILIMFSLGYYSAQHFLPNSKKLVGLIIGLFFLILIGIIFSELIPIPQIIGLQPIRSIQFLIFLSIILLIPYILKLWEQNWIGKFWAVGIGIGIFFFEPKTMLLFFLGSFIYTMCCEGVLLPNLNSCSSGAPFDCTQDKELRHNITLANRLQKRLQSVFAVVIIIVFCVSLPFLWYRITSKIPQWIYFAEGRQSFGHTFLNYIELPGTEPTTSWQEVQLWAKQNSNKESIWLTPPYLSGFRLKSQRSPIVEWKDGALGLFNPHYAIAWWNRMQDFGIILQTDYDWHPLLFRSLASEKLIGIAQKYHAEYIVVEKEKNIPASLVYSNSRFNVYHVRNTNGDSL